MSGRLEIILCWAFVGVLWIVARHIGYGEGFKDGYEQGEKDFKRKGADDIVDGGNRNGSDTVGRIR